MEPFSSEIIISLGVIMAAIITGFFSFVSLINSKDQKVSEFRQDWINELRKELAQYCTQATILAVKISHFKQKEQKNIEDFWKEHREEHAQFYNCLNLIHLRLNPEDDKSIIDMVDDIYEPFAKGNIDSTEVFRKCNKLTDLSQKLLKKEWKRVKRGEWSHFITKWGTLMFFLLVIIYAYQYLSTHAK